MPVPWYPIGTPLRRAYENRQSAREKGLTERPVIVVAGHPERFRTLVAKDSNSTFMRSLDSRNNFSRAAKLA